MLSETIENYDLALTIKGHEISHSLSRQIKKMLKVIAQNILIVRKYCISMLFCFQNDTCKFCIFLFVKLVEFCKQTKLFQKKKKKQNHFNLCCKHLLMEFFRFLFYVV